MAVMQKAVFIDKDGTLLENVPYNVDPAFVELTPNALEGLALLRDAGYGLVLISNQSGVARGYFDEASLQLLLDDLCVRLASAGIDLLGCYYCPHHPGGVVPAYARDCDCRKPRPGLLLRAAAELGLDLAESFLIGDILDDIAAGNRAGCRTILLERGSETEWRIGPLREPDYVAYDLEEAARVILAAPVRVAATERRRHAS